MGVMLVESEFRELLFHSFSFDSELDNVTKNNKGGDWKDREVLELKAFHNEEDGQRNFGTGLSTRLAIIPMPDQGTAERNQQTDDAADETLRIWAYRLDRVEGEIPIEPLNDETYEWQSEHLEIAAFNGDRADRTLLKRIPYYGIGISLSFILMATMTSGRRRRR